MNGVLSDTCFVLFLAAAPAVLGLRLARPQRMSWWLPVGLVAVVGWILLSATVYFRFEHLSDLLAAAGGPGEAPPELVDDWQNDGGSRVVTFALGWLLSLVYLVPWLVPYALVNAFRRSRSTSA